MRGYCLIILLLSGSLHVQAQTKENSVTKATLDFYVEETAKSASFNLSITYQFAKPLGSNITLKVLNFDTPIANSVYFKTGQGGVQRIAFKGSNKIMSGKLTEVRGMPTGSELTVFYRVPFLSSEDRFKLTIPIVYPDIPSASDINNLFTAAIEIDTKWQIHENFPAQTWSVENTEQSTVHRLSLQAIPSVITLKGGTGAKPVFSMMNFVDGAVILVLLVLLFFGWKKIKQV
ncbi:MAG: hypothetical protein HEP71_09190 [Roseivirga sp.]|nr:hypothetical protein [Roseivirga sp.]